MILWGAAWAVTLDLPTAIDQAWASAAEAQVAHARVDRAEAGVGIQLSDPQLRLTADRVGSKLDPTRYQLRVRKDLADILPAFSEARATRGERGIEEAGLGALQEEVRIETVTRFDQVRLLEAELALVEQELALELERVDIVSKRGAAGLEVQKESVDAAFEHAEILRRRALTTHALTVARAELAVWVGQPADTALELTGPDLRETLAAPLTTRDAHLEARIADAEIEAAILEKKAEAAARIPFIDWVQADVQLEPTKVPEWGVGAAIEIPVFRMLDRGLAVAKKEIALHEAERRFLQAEHEAIVSLEQARLTSARTGLASLDEALQVAVKSLEMHQEKLSPDEVLVWRVKLVSEKRRALAMIEEGLEARRLLEAPVMRSL